MNASPLAATTSGTTLFLDPLLLDPQVLRGLVMRPGLKEAEIVVFASHLQVEVLRELGTPRITFLGGGWTSADRYSFLANVYRVLQSIEAADGATLAPWKERFPYAVNIGSLLRHRTENGAILFFLVGYHLRQAGRNWHGRRIIVASGSSRFGEFARYFLTQMGFEVADHIAAHERLEESEAGGRTRRATAHVIHAARQLNAAVPLAIQHLVPGRKGVRYIHLEEHRITRSLADRLTASCGFRLMPYRSRELLSIRTKLGHTVGRSRIEARIRDHIEMVGQAVHADSLGEWQRLSACFLDFFGRELPSMLNNVFGMWWRLDRYRPRCAVRINWFTPIDHSVRMWCRSRGVPYVFLQHGYPSPIVGQFWTAFDYVDYVFCWDEYSCAAFLRSTRPENRPVTVRTGNPLYGGAASAGEECLVSDRPSALVAFTTYGELWLDSEMESWRVVARVAKAMPEVAWTIRQHPRSRIRDFVHRLFAGVDVRISDEKETFQDACKPGQIVITNLSSVRYDAIAMRNPLVVWNDLGIPDPLNDQPGIILVDTVAGLEDRLRTLLRGPQASERVARPGSPVPTAPAVPSSTEIISRKIVEISVSEGKLA